MSDPSTRSARDATPAPRPDVVQAADALRPMVAARADEIEAARRLPPDLSAALARAGLYRTCVPAAYGGLECPPDETLRAIETLARADGSTAWCVFIGATSGSVLALLAPDAAREVFATPETLLGGTFAPMGAAEREPGGYRVRGRWAWGSGTWNADWIMGGCRILRDGAPERGPDGRPATRLLLAPRSEVVFHDTWHVAGLCGTGSTDFEMPAIHVDERFSAGLGSDRPRVAGALYAFPPFGLLAMGIAAVSLGLARAAIDALVELAAAKRPQGSGRTLAERAGTQAAVSGAEAEVRSARAWLYATVEAAWQEARERGRIDVARRRDVRLATTHAVAASTRAVDAMYHLGGGTSVYRRSPLQRIFRDVHVATQHAMVAPSTLELTGRLLLGLDTDVSQL